MTPQEKETIDYKIEARRKAKEKEIQEWTSAGFIALIFYIVLSFIIS